MGSIVEKTETEKLVKAKREYKEYAKYENILKRAIEKNIDVKLFVAVLEARTEDFSLENINKSLIYLEAISREIAKVPWYNKTNFYDIARTLSVVLPASYDEVLKNRFKFDEKKISFFTKDRKVQKYKDKEMPEVCSDPAEFSVKAKYWANWKWWKPQCSWTARNNLQEKVKKWQWEIPVGGSARDSYHMYWSNINIIEGEHKNNNKKTEKNIDEIMAYFNDMKEKQIWDLFLDASPENKEYWHRVAVIKDNWKLYVLDPYYANAVARYISGNKTVKVNGIMPYSLESYLQYMKIWQKRRIWWVHFFEKKEEGKKEKQQN